MNQSWWFSENLNPEKQTTPICTTLGANTDNNSQAPTFWNKLNKAPSFWKILNMGNTVWGPKHRRAIKEVRVISRACSLPQNIYVVKRIFL